MDKKAAFIQKTLNKLFPDPPIPLHHTSPYTLLIAVLLSAQCTDERVNKVTPFLFSLADTPVKMASLKISEIEDAIRSCGLYKFKAKAIHTLSQILVEKYNSVVPDSFEALESLPGIGHKTASVVMSQSFSKLAFPVDTHIFRLARRWGLSKGKTVEKVEADLKKTFPKAFWNSLHLQMIYFARQYCPARNHKEESCPICGKLKDLH